uniref:Uncharacterized protein n=1 Tax=Lepeophtheirus salmonis TaxID=72036 RepID=A0A0K2TKY5_LEPSM
MIPLERIAFSFNFLFESSPSNSPFKSL